MESQSRCAGDRHTRARQIGKSRGFDRYKIAVLVPCYNEGDNAEETLNAALALDYPDFEVIAINDGSKDNTAIRVLEAFLAQHYLDGGAPALLILSHPVDPELIGEVVRYEDSYRLCYVRGPEGIIVDIGHWTGTAPIDEEAKPSCATM